MILICIVFFVINVSPVFGQTNEEVAVLETQLGKIVIEFFPQDAPNHVKNFINLTKSGFYDGTKFHRIIPGFMIQGGDPNSKAGDPNTWGTGNPGYSLDAEFNNIKHNRGIVSMARSADPNSAGSQFFIVHQDSNFLDGQYTVFGRLATQESFETLDKIASLPTNANDAPIEPEKAIIKSAKIVKRSEVSNILDLGPPQRTNLVPTEITEENAEYENDKLGISFKAPQGWSIQEPQKTRPGIPDIVMIGPQTGSINPSISISVIFAKDKTLDDYIKEIDKNLQPSIDSGQLEITSSKKTTIHGKEAHIRNAQGIFQKNNSTIDVQFREVNLLAGDKIYTLTYSSDKQNFENNLEKFDTILDSLSIKDEKLISQDQGGGCLIATATYGSELAPQVQQLRELRDHKIMKTSTGESFLKGFNQLYYSFSPTIADYERQNPLFKEFVKITITPLLSTLSLLNFVEIDSDADMLVYGLFIITLNIGIYFITPLILVKNAKKITSKL